MPILKYAANLVLLPFLLAGTFVVGLVLAASDLIPIKRKSASSSPVDTTKASIVIPNWNGKDLLKQCLPSLVNAIAYDGQDHEIIVVDNNSADDSVSFLRENYPQIKAIPLEANLGFSGGCNTGAHQAKHDVVLFLNNDMIVEDNFLRPLLEPFHDPRVFAVSAQIFLWDKTKRREETGCTRGHFSRGMLRVWHEAIEDQEHLWPTLYPGGGSSVVDKRKFLEIGGFDELYHPFYGEDTDLGYKAWRRGWQVLYQPKSIVYHKHRGTIGKTFSRNYIDDVVEKNRLLFVWKNITDWRVLAQHFCYCFATLILGAISGSLRLLPYIRAVCSLPLAEKGRRHERSFRVTSDQQIVLLSQNPLKFKDRFEEPSPHLPGSRMTILYVTPYFPYPPSAGGHVRMYNLIKHQAQRHDIVLLSFIDRGEEKQGIPEMLQYCKDVRVVQRYLSPRDWNPFGVRPYDIESFDSDKMWKQLENILVTEKIDVIQIEFTQMAQYVSPSRHSINFLTEHDLSLVSYKRRVSFAKGAFAKAKTFLEWLRMLRFELESCKRFDGVLVLAEWEGHELKRYLPDKNIFWDVPTGINLEEFTVRDDTVDRGNRILFVGYFMHTPNVDAALYLAKEVFPLIKQQIPDTCLTIVGKAPTEEIVALTADPNIFVTGFVQDLHPFYNSHSVFLAPIRTGAGMKTKIVEAMAAGIPCVTTTMGTEGLLGEPGVDLLVADSPLGLAEETVRLLKTRDLQKELSRNGRKVVEQHYDNRALADKLEEHYHDLLAEKRGLADAPSTVTATAAKWQKGPPRSF